MNRFSRGRHSVPVIAFEINGSNIIAPSINKLAKYFHRIGVSISAEQIARKIVDGTTFSYSETYSNNGKKITEIHEFCFDELYGDISNISKEDLVL